MLSKTSDIVHKKNGKSITNIGNMKYAEKNAGPHALTSSDNGEHKRIFSYDANGNMINKDGMTCAWDFKDRLIAIENQNIRAIYTYDYTDRRITKKVWKLTTSQPKDFPSLTTTYVNRHFEIREGYQPIKYVFNGEKRVARIIGSLDQSSKRVQRFHLFKGWNLITLAVEATDNGKQMGIGSNSKIEAIFQWLPEQKKYEQIDERTYLPKGTILWVRLKNDVVFSIVGLYEEPAETVLVSAGHSIVSPAALLSVSTVYENPINSIWLYSNQQQMWQARIINKPFISDFPEFINTGQPIHFKTAERSLFELPKMICRIQYYHPDHLGSSNVITDGKGDIIDENVFYPFGHVRQHRRTDEAKNVLSAKYLFTGKELDQESELQYFEARYYDGVLGRFISVDPLYLGIESSENSEWSELLTNPQLLNIYSYTINNPLNHVDPSGKKLVKIVLTESQKKWVILNDEGSIKKQGFVVDEKFVPKVESLLKEMKSKNKNIQVLIYSAFRTSNLQKNMRETNSLATKKASAHEAGLALDFYVRETGKKTWKKPGDIKGIEKIVKDLELRWGPDFIKPDPMHIDAGESSKSVFDYKNRTEAVKTNQSDWTSNKNKLPEKQIDID